MAKIKYDLHPSVAMMQDWIASLEAKTGRSLDEWMKVIKAQKFKDEKSAREFLKKSHDVGTNSAWWLAERAFAKDLSLMDDDPDRYMTLAPKYVSEQYAGKKAGLSPIFERLVKVGRSLGKDVKVCPCKTIVPLYREHVFAQIKPTTQTRVDLGLCLTPLLKAKKEIPARLIATGGFEKKDRITHRVPLESVDQIDAFVEKWMKKAYELDA
jgi:hypothetical protein